MSNIVNFMFYILVYNDVMNNSKYNNSRYFMNFFDCFSVRAYNRA